MIDVVIISDAKDSELRSYTENAIRTARSNALVPVEVYVVESSREEYDCITLHPEEKFNYNRFLNIGAAHGYNEYIAFCNNDIIFQQGWTRITDTMRRKRVESASPYCSFTGKEYRIKANSGTIHGYEVRRLFCGWCYVWTRSLWERIGKPTTYDFWCSDNEVSDMLRRNHVRHLLDTSSHVDHLGSKTLNKQSRQRYDELTLAEVRKWNRNTGENKFGWGK